MEAQLGSPGRRYPDHSMKLKTVTLITAIMQLVTLCCGIFSYVRFLPKMKWEDNAEWIAMQPIYLVSQVTMVLFLFVLFARQNSK
jgi:TRAP-type C4-dicarboxylate transport system permease small subunit